MHFSCTVSSEVASLNLLTLLTCRAVERANSLAIPFSPSQCVKWTRLLAVQGYSYWGQSLGPSIGSKGLFLNELRHDHR